MLDNTRLKLMTDLHTVGKNAEIAFLENAAARPQQQEQQGGNEEVTGKTGEEHGENMECGEEEGKGTGGGSQPLKRKESSRGTDESKEQEGTTQQGKRQHKSTSAEGSTDEGQEEGTTHDTATSGSISQGGEDKEVSQGPVTPLEFDRENEERRRQMRNAENMTEKEILQADEDQRDGPEDMDSSEEGEEQEGSEEEDLSLEQWIQEVEQLEWGRKIECEIRLAHHKHLRNLKQATQVAEDITSKNRFELLRREGEINEFYAAQYATKARPVKDDIHIQQEEYAKIFQWPKTYHNKEGKGESKKRKARREEEQSSSVGLGEETVRYIRDKRINAAILFFDFEKAYDQVKHLWEEGERRWKTVAELRRQLKGCHKLQKNLGTIIEAIPQAWKQLLLVGKQWGMGDWATWEDVNEPKEVFRVWSMENSRPDWLIPDKYDILQPRNTTSQLDMTTKAQLNILKQYLTKVRVIETKEFTVYNSTVAIEELEVDPAEWAWNIRSGQPRISRRINILHYTTRIGYRLRNRSYSMTSTLLNRWEKRVGVPRGQLPKIPWANIGTIRLGQVRSMQWLIAHVALPVNVWLNERRSHRQRSVESEICRVCQEGIPETMLHCLLECAGAVAMWDEARGIWSQVAGIAFPGSKIALLLGVGVPKQWQPFQRHIFQLLRQYGLWTIWKRRCQATIEGTLMHRQEAREIFLTLTETHLKAQWKRVRRQARQQPEQEEEIMKRFKQNVLGQGAVANIHGAQLVFKWRGSVEDIRSGG
ncbi:hypothetical protein CBR_g23228 [Chara braunii]|uniref:Reverse transcriptase zinc-binding domain-containing protein n=1 Tax=Chara braunii TaxID=69332 RepID=A0A388JVD2_CHABU|nr:hypothetical protein CBR_g23228 [Chara braunii]|eukprot:GBG61713.1 hypothetical protein CBR_g23228 [Chara braunii]